MPKKSTVETVTARRAFEMHDHRLNTVFSGRMKEIVSMAESSKHGCIVVETRDDNGIPEFAILDYEDRLYVVRKAP